MYRVSPALDQPEHLDALRVDGPILRHGSPVHEHRGFLGREADRGQEVAVGRLPVLELKLVNLVARDGDGDSHGSL